MKKKSIRPIPVISGNRTNEWIVIINGTEHSIHFVQENKNEKPKLYVDEKEIIIPSSFITDIVGIDYDLHIEDRIVHCTYDMQYFDIAVNGKYVNSKKKYYPYKGSLFVLTAAILDLLAMFVLFEIDISETTRMIGMLGIFGIVFLLTLYMDYLNKKAREE